MKSYLSKKAYTQSGSKDRKVSAGCRRLEQIKPVLISVNEGPRTPGDESLL